MISLDCSLGIVRTGALHLSTTADVDHYVDLLSKYLSSARRRYGNALVLADLRNAPIRSQDTADSLRRHNQSLYQRNERVALLVASSLLKLQLRRNLVPELQNIFMSENAAITWLLAGNHTPINA